MYYLKTVYCKLIELFYFDIQFHLFSKKDFSRILNSLKLILDMYKPNLWNKIKDIYKKKKKSLNFDPFIFLVQQKKMTSSFKGLAPLLNRVLIKKFEPVTKSAGGIILQDSEGKEQVGKVVELGPGNFAQDGKIVPLSVKKGDTVLLPDYGGTKVKLSEGDFWLYRDSDILGVLKEWEKG